MEITNKELIEKRERESLPYFFLFLLPFGAVNRVKITVDA